MSSHKETLINYPCEKFHPKYKRARGWAPDRMDAHIIAMYLESALAPGKPLKSRWGKTTIIMITEKEDR